MPDLTQKQTVTVTATSTTSTTPIESESSFDLTFLDPCVDSDSVTITTTSQNDEFTNSYDGQTVTFTYNPFTVSPSWCEAIVKCASVTPSTYLKCQELDSNDETQWTFTGTDYTNGLKPGTYVYQYTVEVAG